MKFFSKHPIEKSDEELIRAYQQDGDAQHIAQLYSKYIELVYGLCLKCLKDKEGSEDAVMDIYEVLLKKLKSHQVDYFKSWLYILSKNHCLGEIRKQQKQHKLKEAYGETQTTSETFHPFDDGMKEQLLDKLDDCLQKLIDTQKTCITQFYIEKQSYKEISSNLSLSWNRVRSLIQNGRRNLKLCIEQS